MSKERMLRSGSLILGCIATVLLSAGTLIASSCNPDCGTGGCASDQNCCTCQDETCACHSGTCGSRTC